MFGNISERLIHNLAGDFDLTAMSILGAPSWGAWLLELFCSIVTHSTILVGARAATPLEIVQQFLPQPSSPQRGILILLGIWF